MIRSNTPPRPLSWTMSCSGASATTHPDAAGPHPRPSSATSLTSSGSTTTCSDVGLDFNVGAGGRRLTGGAATEARCCPGPDQARRLYDFQPAAARLDQRVQDQVLRNVLKKPGRGGHKPAIVWVLYEPGDGGTFRSRDRFRLAVSWSRTEHTRHCRQGTVSSKDLLVV